MNNPKIVLFNSGVWAANFMARDEFNATADKLVARFISNQTTILVPEIVRAEVLNVVFHRSLDKNQIKFVDDKFQALSPVVQFRQGDPKFWNEFMPQQFSRLFLKTMDFLVASYAFYWEVEAFYSFDEKLNIALRRIKPEIVKLKIRRGRVIEV
jgi:predicted nucleic acid-binding protein